MVSSKDVAKYAGVSQTTVSRVLNVPHLVQPKTLAKVQAAIAALHYKPNSIARSLVSNTTKSIALLSGPLHNPFFAESVTAIVQYAKERGYDVNVHFESFGDNESVYDDLVKNKVDGILLSSIFLDDPIFPQLATLDVPCVFFNRKHREQSHYVEMDNVAAGRLATEHLLSLGHRDIVWLGGPLKMSTFWGRYEGFRQAMAHNGCVVNDDDAIVTDTSEAAIKREVLQLLARKRRPTAIVAATDSIAIYVIDELTRIGYHIPDDMSLIGIDNVALSNHAAFQLSTVSLAVDDNLGRLGVEKLIDLIEAKQVGAPYEQVTLPVALRLRQTTKPQ